MIFSVQQGHKGRVLDLDTGKDVGRIVRLDLEDGEARRQDDGGWAGEGVVEYYRTIGGKMLKDARGWQTVIAAGRFRWVPQARKEIKALLGAAKCARCPSTLTLPGDDLCAPCLARERGQRNRMVAERITSPILGARCESCSRDADWAVSDEVDASPVVMTGRVPTLGRGKFLWERGAAVGIRYYCSRHYKAPRLLDSKGEVICEQPFDKARPQWTS